MVTDRRDARQTVPEEAGQLVNHCRASRGYDGIGVRRHWDVDDAALRCARRP
jgi:hypothetical protein